MAGTFKKIDYRLRPAKHAERTMFLELFKRFRFKPIETYQYVGFGSVAFIDFRMVHKSLGIQDLISIEATQEADEQVRFRNNCPYESIALCFGHSSSILPSLDFSKQSLVWLDYDGALSRSMANDIATVGRKIPSGSFVAATFTIAHPATGEGRARELARLKEEFPEFLPEDAKVNVLDGQKFSEFGRSSLGALLATSVAEADAGLPISERRKVMQLCFFRYKDGVQMVTVGWLIVAECDMAVYENCHFNALPFYRDGDIPFKITVPLVTPFEVREMERRLPDLASATDLEWIPEGERQDFANVYRYLPHFSVVEQI